MKFKCGESLLLALLLFFLELIKRCCPQTSIIMVDPLIIKINSEKYETIPIIILLDEKIENRARKKIRLQSISQEDLNKELYSNEEKDQDQINKKKIEFKINQKDFEGYYGKFNLSYIDENLAINPIYYNQTIFIYTNDLILKNPKKKYFLTGQGIAEVRYDFSLPIFEDEINLIKFYEAKDPDKKYILSKRNYTMDGNMKLKITFSKTNSYSSYIFDIFPEYDKTISNSEIQRFYLYFHDYLLNNDAIYINKNDASNRVPFNLTFRDNQNLDNLSIRGYSFTNNHLGNNDYELTINLGRQSSPGKIFLSYNGQERELFYILYDSNFYQKCYDKEDMESLDITLEWIDEMEYDHYLYFNDTTTKILTGSYGGKSSPTSTTLIYKYKSSTISLSSGIFSLKSSIPSLSSNYNPVDNNHLLFYIYPNLDTFDNNSYTIFSHNNSNQYIYISSSEPNGTTVLDEIILRKEDNTTEILVSRGKGNCGDNNTHFYCDLKDLIYNFDSDKNGDYSIIYKDKCNQDATIKGKVVTIKKGIGLSDISPRWIKKSQANNSKLFLTYDDDLTKRDLEICFTDKKEDDSPCKYIVNKSKFTTDKEKVIISLDNIEEGRYYVRTKIRNDSIDFIQKDKSFKVSDPKLNFTFNHHYFVKNDNPENKLKITVYNPKENFGCLIVENIENKTLNHGPNNCSIFEYKIDRIGTIRFNYSDDENFTIPINDSIVVVSNYPQFFSFNEKFCYYFKFDISIDILNSYKGKLNIKVFLKDRNNTIIPLNNSNDENKYNYDINSSFFDYQGFDFYISENEIDDVVYLYKSNEKVKFTEIETPEFIIDPNKTIVFSNVNCNLNSSTFKILRMETPDVQNSLSYFEYDSINRYLSFKIEGDFYQANRFKDYYYQIDYNNITNFTNESEIYKTFVSKRLNETNFELKIADSNDQVTIINKEKDFYFPLISNLTTIQEYRLPQRIKTSTRDDPDLDIKDDEYTIIFYYKLAINDVLNISHLQRTVYNEWEKWENLGNSMYYYFNKSNIINGSSLVISPKLFAFNTPNKEKYMITILYSEAKQKNYTKTNITCPNEENNILEEECYIVYNLTNNIAQNVTINISDNINNFYEYINFVYYHLDENSKKCQTMDSNMNNITLLVDIPTPNLKDKIKLESTDTDIIDEKRENNAQISFILNGSNINLQRTYLHLFTDDAELDHLFTLQELRIDILPKYKIRFNTNKNKTYLLKEDNQVVKVIISVDNNEIINLTDISGFKIIGEKTNKEYQVGKNPISGEPNALNLIFNLSSVNDISDNYLLYYIDRCGKNFSTNLTVSFISFNFKRKYFVLNNNKNLKYQILKIEGPADDDKISISVYRNLEYNGEVENNGSNYYFNFSQTSQRSQGNYTFRVINDGIESLINETVYVRENLEEILKLKNDDFPNCMFSNENKSAIKNFSYTITPSNLNTNFTDFQSYFSADEKDFTNLTSVQNEADKTFSILYTDRMKNNIKLNNKLYIYLTESDDIEQPIYIFNYSYTNIELHPDFSKLIYTDADYILFKMNCRINNMKNFVFNSINRNTYSITCEDRDTNDMYNEADKIFKCYLSSSDHGKNRLLDFGQAIKEYGNYNITYDQIQITNEPFFLSQDIYNAGFIINTPSQIDRNVDITINITTPNIIFYFPEVETVTYKKNKEENENNIEFKFNNTNNYIFFNLYIESQTNYTINKICRKPCSYCRKNGSYVKIIDCQPLNGDPIRTNTPYVNFTFNKHYIALENSSYIKNNETSISTLKIEVAGDDQADVQELIYYHYITPTNINGPRYINRQNGIFQLDLSKGKYTFQYRYRLNNRVYNIRDVVLVTTYDYEMFDFSDFSSKCIFYDLNLPERGLLVSINPNPNYDFKNDIIIDNLILELNEVTLSYIRDKGYYRIINDNMFINNDNYFKYIHLRESDIPNDFVFTTFDNIYSYTFDSNSLNKYDGFYYKDNIVFEQQNCQSNNIYIRSLSTESFSLLKCDYIKSNKTQYCDAFQYNFSFRTNDNFYLYFGINKLRSSFEIKIYNSIKDSNFDLYYINPTIYIESTNFDLTKINNFIIDITPIYSFNKTSDPNLITYVYEADNITEHYVKELWRITHGYDRNITIKNKTVNLKIQKRQCPEFSVEVKGESGTYCITCAQKASIPGESGKIWYQNGECVSSCSGDFAIYDQVNHYCLNCSEKTTTPDGQTICGCIEGTVKNPLNGVCYLPEHPEIKRVSLIRSNVQCYRTDGITHNYCKNDTTSKCEIVSYSGYDFPICHCKDGYTGKYCENKINEINLNNNVDDILNGTESDKIDESSIETISKIRGITYFIEKDNSYTNNIDINKINTFLETSINCINDAINEKHNYPQIYDVIEITVHFLLYKIKNSKRLRLLEEEDEENRNNLKHILEKAHYLNYLANKNYTGSNYNIQTDGLNLISFISFRPDAIDSSFKTYIKNRTSDSSIIGYTNLTDNKVNDNGENAMAVLTIFNRALFNIDSSENGLIYNFSISDNSISLPDLKDFKVYFYSQNMNINFDLANYYHSRNINIYDKYDPCFTDKCFTSKEFEFDLTQKYRKKNVFQKWSLDSDICRYHSFENASNNIEISCKKFEDFGKMDESYNYATLDLIVKKDYIDNQDKVYNLPFKCKKKFESENYAFWIFLIICILEIIYIIGITILTTGSLRKVSINKGLRNDGLFYIIPRIINTNDDISSNHDNPLKKENDKYYNNPPKKVNNEYYNDPQEKVNDEYYNSVNEIYEKPIGTYNKTLLEGILSNFKELHPLSVFCRVSIISPLIMNSWFFVFNSLCLFGFNALIYYEGLIEKRIYDKKRNNFDYPMRKEFHKIILSILLQIALTVIVKAIILVFLNQYEDLESKLRKCKMKGKEINNDIILRHDNFQDEMLIRRLIGGFLMAIIIIFFFYYSVVFCEVYIKTQRNLVFSWIWSLFWEWIVFAPIYIVIISVLENKKSSSKDPLIYYLKRFFFF